MENIKETPAATNKPAKVKKQSKAAALKETLEKNQITKDGGKAVEAKPEKEPKKSKRPEQLPLAGIKVKLDATGKAAQRFGKALEALEDAQDEKGAASEALIKAMKKAKRLRITVNGYDFQIIHEGPKDKVKVTKPK